MAEEPPKLFSNKPSKAQLKQFQEHRGKDFSSSMASPPPPPPPPPPPKESFVRRYKFLWPMLLAVNLAVGGYLFVRTKGNKDSEDNVEEEATTLSSSKAASDPNVTVEKPQPSPEPIKEPAKLREPIPESQQRELFKWMLDQKRKVKPQSPEEKKRIDEEKALLKQLIRSKTIPTI